MPKSFLIKKHGAAGCCLKRKQDCIMTSSQDPGFPHQDFLATEVTSKTLPSSQLLPPCSPSLPMSPMSRQDEVHETGCSGAASPGAASPVSTGASPAQRTPSPFSISAILSSPGSRSPPSRPLAFVPQPFYPVYAPFFNPADREMLSPPLQQQQQQQPLASPQQPQTPVRHVETMDYTVTTTPVKKDFDPKIVTEAPAVPRREGPPRFNCDGCGKTYATFSGLSKHKRFHCVSEIKKEFSCKFCDKTYSSLGALKMHIRTHTLPCKCPLCGKAFSRPWLLQGHIRTHTGEKPFSCQHCHRSFADRSNLRAHLQTHTDIKKYNCKCCSKTFSRMSLLIKHEDGGCPGANVSL